MCVPIGSQCTGTMDCCGGAQCLLGASGLLSCQLAADGGPAPGDGG
jgi:hypothetical protein